MPTRPVPFAAMSLQNGPLVRFPVVKICSNRPLLGPLVIRPTLRDLAPDVVSAHFGRPSFSCVLGSRGSCAAFCYWVGKCVS